MDDVTVTIRRFDRLHCTDMLLRRLMKVCATTAIPPHVIRCGYEETEAQIPKSLNCGYQALHWDHLPVHVVLYRSTEHLDRNFLIYLMASALGFFLFFS